MTFGNYQEYWPYGKARSFVRKQGIKTALNYQLWAAGKSSDRRLKPKEIPSNPHQIYGDEWKGYADWLGTKRVATFNRKFLPYDQARGFASRLELESYEQWRSYCGGEIPGLGPRPAHIPSNPSITYRGKGWCGIRHWLGVGPPEIGTGTMMVPFDEARNFARALGLKGVLQWRRYVAGKMPQLPARPANIPSNPNVCYCGEGWTGYGDFLGTGQIAYHRLKKRPFVEAREFARSLNLKNMKVWNAWAESEARPADIPASPARAYRGRWKSWHDWLRGPLSMKSHQQKILVSSQQPLPESGH